MQEQHEPRWSAALVASRLLVDSPEREECDCLEESEQDVQLHAPREVCESETREKEYAPEERGPGRREQPASQGVGDEHRPNAGEGRGQSCRHLGHPAED